ncbi:MAG: glycosyltransferase family 4 protein [Halobacteriales archaeon]|nr:glycosyltransferase family 4 protein [Halobacteriales archaeon]
MPGLRIAMACPNFLPHVGGVESHVACISEGLAARGHDMTVLTASQPGAPARERIGGVQVERLPRMASPVGTPVTPALARRARELRPDILHSHSPPPVTSWHAGKAALRGKLTHVLTYHCDLDLPRAWGPLAVGAYERTLLQTTLRSAALVLATTQGYADTSRALWRVPESRRAIVPNPVDVQRFRPGLATDWRARLGLDGQPMALFVGRLAHHKGIEHFVQSAQHSGSAVHVVAGEGPLRPTLERLAARQAPGKVRFAGKVLHEELPALYAACDLAVLPSVSRLEAFGIAVLEAMASGKPVVVADIPGVREVVEPGKTGVLAQPMRPEDLGARIRELAEDPPRRARMGQAGRERAERSFSVDAVVDRLEKAYASVLRR